jgi:WD40 repeat protein
VLLYDPDSGALKKTLPTSNHTAIAFAPDGQRVAVHSHNDILLYNVMTGKQQSVLHGHTSTVNSLAFSPNGQTLVSGSSDRTVRLWSADGRLLTTLTEHYSSVSHVGFTPDGKSLVCTEDTGKLRVMPAQSATAAVDIPTQTDRLRGLALAPDSRQIAVIRAAGDILLIGVPAKR